MSETAVPGWAYENVTNENSFDVTSALEDKTPESTGSNIVSTGVVSTSTISIINSLSSSSITTPSLGAITSSLTSTTDAEAAARRKREEEAKTKETEKAKEKKRKRKEERAAKSVENSVGEPGQKKKRKNKITA